MRTGPRTCCTEMCSGSEAGSYLSLIDFVYHSSLGLRVMKKERKPGLGPEVGGRMRAFGFQGPGCRVTVRIGPMTLSLGPEGLSA